MVMVALPLAWWTLYAHLRSKWRVTFTFSSPESFVPRHAHVIIMLDVLVESESHWSCPHALASHNLIVNVQVFPSLCEHLFGPLSCYRCIETSMTYGQVFSLFIYSRPSVHTSMHMWPISFVASEIKHDHGVMFGLCMNNGFRSLIMKRSCKIQLTRRIVLITIFLVHVCACYVQTVNVAIAIYTACTVSCFSTRSNESWRTEVQTHRH